MAEFCLDCENEALGPEFLPLDEGDVKLAMDWCEGCGEYKPCIVCYRWHFQGPYLRPAVEVVQGDEPPAPIRAGLPQKIRHIAQKIIGRGK